MYLKQLLLVVLFNCYQISLQNNVCKTYNQYWLRTTGCYYNPDQNTEIWDIITSHGYPLEIHNVSTSDGYNLQIFRIPNADGTPVIMLHGIYTSAISFADTGTNSLAFLLSNAGFDVWLVSLRGTRYSLTHQTYATNSLQYWNFSWHEMGAYDLKTSTDLVWSTTNKQSIVLGFSMGTTVSYVYNILYPNEAIIKWKHIISLAPIAYLTHAKASIIQLRDLWIGLYPAAVYLENGVLFQRSTQSSTYLNTTCLNTPLQMTSCLSIMQSIFGYDWNQVNYELYPVTAIQNPDSLSAKLVNHYYQNIQDDDFRYYDGVTPYNISAMNVNITLYYASNDYLSVVPDVIRFYNNLNILNKVLNLNADANFTHMDYLTAKDVATLLYNAVIQRMLSL